MGRSVKQGFVLSPFHTLFLTVMERLLQLMKVSNYKTSTRAVYSGVVIYADDLWTIVSSYDEVLSQADVVQKFTDDTS